MCGRFKLVAPGQKVAEQFGLAEVPVLEPRYNVAPGQTVPVVRLTAFGRELVALRWGLVPSWAKDPAVGYRLLNARYETVAEKPAYRAAYKQRRCLLPADGFNEWQKVGRTKQPTLFRLRDELFAFAGLWESWRGREGAALESCTILTTAANDLVRPLHERMPVILAPADYAGWLDPRRLTAGETQRLFRPFSDLDMTATVNPWVNDARHEGPRCVESVEGRALCGE